MAQYTARMDDKAPRKEASRPGPYGRISRSAVDWEALRRDYGSTPMSDKELSAAHGVSINAIRVNRNRFPHLWPRDQRVAMVEATENALIRANVEAHAKAVGNGEAATKARLTTEQQVAATVALNVAIIQRHRSDITRAADVTSTMISEVVAAGLAQADIDLSIAILNHAMPEASEDDVRVAAETLRKATQLDARAKTLAQLADTMVKLQLAERKAWNLDAQAREDDVDFVARLMSARDRAASRLA